MTKSHYHPDTYRHVGWSQRRRHHYLSPLTRKLPRWMRRALGIRRPDKCFICRKKTMWGAMIDRRGFLGRWCHMNCGVEMYGARLKDWQGKEVKDER